MNYQEQIESPLWQKKRLEILNRDNFTCQICLDTKTQLHVHHKYYDKTWKTMAWEYPDDAYKTLCSDCHSELTIHEKKYGKENTEFDVMKIKRPGRYPIVFVYSNGVLKFNQNKEKTDWMNITENTTHKIVQFLINNWLKNGETSY